MKLPRIPLNLGTVAQLATFLQSRVLNAIQVGWSVEHRADNYHEFRQGTWTPFDASGAGLALTTRDSVYIKIGQLVICGYFITFPATADGATNLIGGLPFQSATDSQTSAGPASTWVTAVGITTDAANAFNFTVSPRSTTGNFRAVSGIGATNAQLSSDVMNGYCLYLAAPE